MTTFLTEADFASGTGETVESEVWLALEFTVPAGDINFLRWRWPAGAISVTPLMRLFNAGGTALEIGGTGVTTLAFDTSTADQFNSATPASPFAVSAGTYRATVNTTRYIFKSGFFSGGPVVRGDITGVQSRFGSPGSAPTSTSTTLYGPDIDFTAASSPTPIAVGDAGSVVSSLLAGASAPISDAGSAADAVAAAVALSFGDTAAAADVAAVIVAAGLADAGTSGEALTVAVAAALADSGLAVDLGDGEDDSNVQKALADIGSAIERLRTTTVRPNTGITTRPFTGITLRP